MRAPERGTLIWLTFTPHGGPALVVSPSGYNSKVGLALVCPITRKVKGYPFEVPLPEGGPVQGVVLADQLRSLDWHSRQAETIGTAPMAVLERVLQLVGTLLSGNSAKRLSRGRRAARALNPTIRPFAGNNLGRRPIGRANANALAAKG